MRLNELVHELHASFPIDDSMRQLAELCALDRFQASRGIQEAAIRVSEFAERAGLEDVRIRQFPANGERQWWTFRAPRAWSPVTAQLRAGVTRDCPVCFTSYPRDACSLATNSSDTPAYGSQLRLVEWNPALEASADGNWLAVIPPSAGPLGLAIQRATEQGAAGIVATAGSARVSGHVGRIELPATSRIFGFSVSREQLIQLLDLAGQSGFAHATVIVDRSVTMPLVEGVLPGASEEEVLLTAHLCHNRPGANDNLSGVVGLLGLCRSLALLAQTNDYPLQRGIRFLWGPEFTGMAAYLHDLAEHRRSSLPTAVINLDMIGEDQQRCGGPLILEAAPTHVASCLEPIAARCLSLLPRTNKSYSGAISVDTWNWELTPFVGASDHGLFADRTIARPAVMLGHWPDRFNHSSADSPDKVSPEELRRAAVVGGALAWSLAATPAAMVGDVAQSVALWGQTRMAAVVERTLARSQESEGTIDPWSNAVVADLFGTSHQAAIGAVESAAAFWSATPDNRWNSVREWLDRQRHELSQLLPPRGADSTIPGCQRPGVLMRRWPGPFNLLGLTEDAKPTDAEWINDRLSESAGGYAILVALALAIDDASERHAVVGRAACESWLPIPLATANGFFDILVRTGWAVEQV